MIGGWEDLEQKVLNLVKKVADLQVKNEKLLLENEIMKEKLDSVELSLLKEADACKVLEDEKRVMKSSIEAMLTSISSLETV